jgi:DNA ligase-4
MLISPDIMTGVDTPSPRSKFELEALVKQNGGSIFQTEKSQRGIFVIADKGNSKFRMSANPEIIRVAALKKRGTHDILRPRWLLESINMNFVLPIEPR